MSKLFKVIGSALMIAAMTLIGVFAFFFLLISFAQAGPKERIAIAEAAVWVAQNQFPAGENDYNGSKSGSVPEIPDNSKSGRQRRRQEFIDLIPKGDPLRGMKSREMEVLNDEGPEVTEKELKLLRKSSRPPELDEDGELKPLTDEEFEEFKRFMREEKAKREDPPAMQPPRFEFPADIEPITANADTLTVTIYTAERFNGDGWCSRCNSLKRDWGSGDDRVSIEWSRDRVPEGGEASYPAIRFQGRQGYSQTVDSSGRYKIPSSLGELASIVEANSSPASPSQAVASSGAAGAIHAKSQIQTVFSWWRANIGEGVKAEMRWDRSGAQSFPLLAKGDWSALALFGQYGHVNLSAKGAVNLPVDAIGFGYRVNGDDITIDADPVTLKGLGQVLNPTSKKSLQVGSPSQIGPGAVLTIVSVVRGLWSLLNPTCDLQLGGNVSATAVLTGDTLAIDFQQCPSVKLVALFTFQLRVDRIEVVEDKHVRVLFGGSRLVKERTFTVK